MQTLFSKILFFLFIGLLFSFRINPPNPEQFNHNLIRQVSLETESAYHQNFLSKIKENILFIKEGEIFFDDNLLSEISNIIRSGIIQDIAITIEEVTVNEIKIIFKILFNKEINKIELSNVTTISRNKILNVIQNKEKQIMNFSYIKSDVDEIEKLYSNAGYVLARVSNIFFIDSYDSLIINVEEGEIDKIILNDLETINSKLIYREMSLEAEKVLNMNKLRQDRLALMKLGYFSKVSVPSIVPSALYPGKVNIVYDVTETKINNLQIGLEQLPNSLYSLTLGLRFPNFRNEGDGIYLKTQTLIRDIMQDYNYYFKYNEPWPFGIKMPFNLILWHQVNKENALGTNLSFSVQRTGWEANVHPLYVDDRKILLGFAQEDVMDQSNTFQAYNSRALKLAYIQNNITDSNHPKKGTMHLFEVEKGNNLFNIFNWGGIDYAKYEFKYTAFDSFLNGVLGYHFEIGYLDLGDGTINLFEQDYFSLGGAYSLRGYKDAYVDPADAISGTNKFLINIEYRMLLLEWLQFAIFLDWGNATNQAIDFAKFKTGSGFGFRFFTPLVPIRLDFGFSKEEDFILHFGLGQAF
jgi:outer membrane protein insertion porin family